MDNSQKGMIFDIQRASFVDGPGIRTTVFFKGCNLACKWCHNPESQKMERQLMFHKNKCTGCGACLRACPNGMQKCDLCGACVEVCPNEARELCGKEHTVEEVLEIVKKDIPFYGTEGGVTFSGGECMLQPDFLEELLRSCGEVGVHRAVDTAGCVPWSTFERILPHTDLFLYDLKAVTPELHKAYTGADNGIILENLKRLLELGKRVWIRIPLMGGVNDTPEEVEKMRAFLAAYHPERVEVLPYHAMGEHKYTALGWEVEQFQVPSPERLVQVREILCT